MSGTQVWYVHVWVGNTEGQNFAWGVERQSIAAGLGVQRMQSNASGLPQCLDKGEDWM